MRDDHLGLPVLPKADLDALRVNLITLPRLCRSTISEAALSTTRIGRALAEVILRLRDPSSSLTKSEAVTSVEVRELSICHLRALFANEGLMSDVESSGLWSRALMIACAVQDLASIYLRLVPLCVQSGGWPGQDVAEALVTLVSVQDDSLSCIMALTQDMAELEAIR